MIKSNTGRVACTDRGTSRQAPTSTPAYTKQHGWYMVPDAIEMETRTRSPSNEPRTEDDGDEEREGLLDGGLKPTDGQPRL